MQDEQRLRSILGRIDGRGYKAYKDIAGSYRFSDFELSIDHVQGDPFAAPSRIRLRMDRALAGFPAELADSRVKRVALADFLTRAAARAIDAVAKGRRGSGRSGQVGIDRPGQEVLERTSVLIHPETIEARLTVGLPARGRRVLGRQAEAIFFRELPEIAARSLRFPALEASQAFAHVRAVEDQHGLRGQLEGRGLVAFVADGSLLPRRSGVDDRPLERGAVAFQSPPELRVELEAPNGGPLRGLGVPRGVTLIVGGGFHGKSTLLRALERGVYDHIPGDGRERVVTLAGAVKIRSEDGRPVQGVDISPFINNLPLGKDTRGFTSPNASGSTSQAANIMEALEVGCPLLLIDEDTSATNFMIRDARMQRLISKDREPITPFVDRAGQLARERGVSTVLVMGGSGDYFEQADQVIAMDEYRPRDVTSQVERIVSEQPSGRKAEAAGAFGQRPSRRPDQRSFDPSKGRRSVKISVKGRHTILFGRHNIDLSAAEQLADSSQTRAAAYAVHYFARQFAARGLDLREGLRQLERRLHEDGLDLLAPYPMGDLARPRRHEIAAAINRLRTLRVRE